MALLVPAIYRATNAQREIAEESSVSIVGKDQAFVAKVNGLIIKAYHFKDHQDHEFYLLKTYDDGWGKKGIGVVHRPDCEKCNNRMR